ncbi:MAG TPA: winged helix-turn-helix domain-containing protein [Mycobacteriales bacterium]
MAVERRPATEEEARTLASPLRLRILRLCLDVSLTNKEIAERLGKDPASVLYHVRRLVRTGFLVAEQERRGTRGAREVPYRSTGKSWTLSIGESEDPRIGASTLVEAFVQDATRIGFEKVDGTRMGLRLTPDEYEELARRLQDLVEEFRLRESTGAPWSLFIGLHPDDRPV